MHLVEWHQSEHAVNIEPVVLASIPVRRDRNPQIPTDPCHHLESCSDQYVLDRTLPAVDVASVGRVRATGMSGVALGCR